MPGAGEAVGSALDVARRGLGASLEDTAVAALVALPFSGTLAIFLGSLGLPGAVGIVLAGVAQALGMFWIAGYRMPGA
jgi:hypothetical protein